MITSELYIKFKLDSGREYLIHVNDLKEIHKESAGYCGERCDCYKLGLEEAGWNR